MKAPSAFLFQFGYFVAEDSSLVNDVEVTGTDQLQFLQVVQTPL